MGRPFHFAPSTPVMRYFLFDLDGTLIDSAPSILKSFAAILKDAGIEPVVPLESNLIGPPLLQTLERISGVQDSVHLVALADAFKAYYDRTGYQETVVYPGVAESLAQLDRLGARLYIVTNKRIAPTRLILDYFGWTRWFDGVYAQDAFVPALPSKAAVIKAVLDHHAINADEAAYIGDRQEDGEAAKVNRLRFIWAQWGYSTEIDPSLCREGDVISCPAQLLDSFT